MFDDWARRGRAEGMERSHARAARRAFERLAVRDGERYLDIGCGNGYSLPWAVAEGATAVGLDVSPEMIERARRGVPGAELHVATFPDHGLARGSFDAVFSMEVFYYLPDLPAGLREARALLRDGGRFACVVDFYRENEASHSWPEELGLSLALLSKTAWRDAFAAAGFAAIEQERVRVPLPPGQPATWKHTEGSLLTYGVAG